LASWWSGSKSELARHLEPDKQPAYLASGEPNYGESLKEYLGPGAGKVESGANEYGLRRGNRS